MSWKSIALDVYSITIDGKEKNFAYNIEEGVEPEEIKYDATAKKYYFLSLCCSNLQMANKVIQHIEGQNNTRIMKIVVVLSYS